MAEEVAAAAAAKGSLGVGREKQVIRTVEMHTGGEPLRIVVAGYPPILGDDILLKRRYVREQLDHLRVLLMAEPRGHADMYGAILVTPDLPEADMAVLFMHNEGYSTMCGHAIISLGRYAVDYNLVEPVSPETKVNIQCPCGLVRANVQYNSETGQTGSVRFHSVAAFAFAVDQTIDVEGIGTVQYDIGYGGAFYALVSVHQLGMDLKLTPVGELVEAATAISNAVRSAVQLSHPESADLAFLYGTILTDGRDDSSHTETANLCVFADRQVDRSPTGSGVTARMAVQYHKGFVGQGCTRKFINSKVGSIMEGKVAEVVAYGNYEKAVVVEVSGCGHYTGEASFWVDKGDNLAPGFLVK